MKLLCITDPTTHPAFDTTVRLYRTFARHPNIDFYHAPVACIDASGDFRCVSVTGSLSDEDFMQLDDRLLTAQSPTTFDLVFNRADEPVPQDFYHNLAKLEHQTRFVNRPSQLDEVRRKDFLETYGHQYLPDHIFSSSLEEIGLFFEQCDPMVAKLNVSYGGKGVYKIWRQGERVLTDNVVEGQRTYPTLEAVLAHLGQVDPGGTFEFVKFLKNIDAGDKRVLVVGGEIYGALLRKASTDTWVHNVTAGATYYAAQVGAREQEIIDDTYRQYQRRGVYTLGYDFLMDDEGEWILSEVNAGNIGGYDWLEEISGEPIMTRLTDWLMDFAESA
ncbi:MAG: hypothetical protein AAFU71_04715 [Cyanobacteria bacterium J06632_22]